MKAYVLFASLNQNRTIEKNRSQNKTHFMGDVFLKTWGIIYLNVESWFLFAPPLSKFLATCLPAGKGADMSELQAQHCMTPEQ